MLRYRDVADKLHRLVPSKFPPIQLFDWAETPEELEQIAALEGLTNERLLAELGDICLVDKADWVLGPGASPLMAAFTHVGYPSRFSDGSYGIYYAADSLLAAIRETVYHRERFYRASQEAPCALSMREYIATLQKPLVAVDPVAQQALLNPNPESYALGQAFAKEQRLAKQWGLYYPSVRSENAHCFALFRPKAISIPVQGGHFKYIWDGNKIAEVYKENRIKALVPC